MSEAPGLCKECSDRLYERWRKHHAECVGCGAFHPCHCGGLARRQAAIKKLEGTLEEDLPQWGDD